MERRRALITQILLCILPLLFLALVGCGSNQQGPIEEGTYLSTHAEGEQEVDAVTLRLEGETISLNAGCNTISGHATWRGNTLVVNEATTTEMGCDSQLHDLDTYFASQLSQGVEVDSISEGFIMTLEEAIITFHPQDDTPVEGQTWRLTSVISGDAASSVPEGVSASLFIDEGQAEVTYGCNTGSGAVEVKPSTLVFDEQVATLMACDDSAMKVETHMQKLLSGEVEYEIEGKTLRLTSGDQGAEFRGD